MTTVPATTRNIHQLVNEMMRDHGFAATPPNTVWWFRPVEGGLVQAVRVVVWGLGSKNRPHLWVEVVADFSAERLAARKSATHAPTTLQWEIPLDQPWREVRAAVERDALARLDTATRGRGARPRIDIR